MKKFLVPVSLLVALLLAVGCAPSKSEANKVIGVSMNMTDEYRMNWLTAFKAKAEAAGYTVITTDAANQVSKQISDVESLITQAPAVIVMTPVDGQGSVPAAEAAKNANLPLVIVDIPLASEKYDVLVSHDQGVNGRLLGEYLNQWLQANPGKTLKAGYIVGAYIPAAMPRMTELFKTSPAVTKVAEAEGGWNADKGMKITEDWLQSHPEINVIAAMNDEMAIGAIQALQAANRKDVLVLGVDGTQNGQKYVRSGELNATTWADLDALVTKCVEVAIGLATGVTYEKEIAPQDGIRLLTKDTIDSVIKQ